jgi:predicted SprT family Zn-dependent metalloprotease
MAEHGLIDSGWRFGWDNAQTIAGRAYSDKRITLSRVIYPRLTDEQGRDTCLHEVAHALAGVRVQHGPEWRRVARSIGCISSRCFSYTAEAREEANASCPWVGSCPSCGNKRYQHQQPTRVRACSACGGRTFDPRFIFTWTHYGRPVEPPHHKYRTELRQIQQAYKIGIYADSPLPSSPLAEAARQLVAASASASAERSRPVALDPLLRFRRGDQLRITGAGAGRFHGLVGSVEKVGRSRYHVRVPGQAGLVTVPFSMAERVS